MKEETVSDLVCPNVRKEKKCRGDLSLEAFSEKKGEILFGVLTCRKCRTKYPIIEGIPILLENIKQYFKDNFNNIKDIITEEDTSGRDLLFYMRTLRHSAFERAKKTVFRGPAHIANESSGYFLLHYDALDSVSHTPLVSDLIKLHKENNAYKIIEKWLSGKDLKGKKALDVGCNTGGLTHFLAERCRLSYGVDISFDSLLKASRVTKHTPSVLDEYKVNENGKERVKKIRIEKVDNIDFILASADNLPFKDRTFEISISSSVLDIARNNAEILKEADRTLKKEGEIFLSFVPLFSKLKDGKDEFSLTAENVKKIVKNLKFYQEFKNVPFIIRNSENFYNIYDNYCMIGGKIKFAKQI